MHSSLLHTERKLIAIFLVGAFLFLIIFEGFFLISRFVFEENISRAGFANEMKRIETHMPPEMGRRGKGLGPRIGMTVILVNKSGALISESGKEEGTFYEEILSGDFLNNLEQKTIVKKDDILVYKRENPENPEFYQIFLRKAGYPLEDLLRDILRFLILDMLIIVPFYFMGRYFVRKTLEPVGKNMDTMSHFIHDAGHELKTPLAIISGNLQILRESKKIEKDLIEESIQTIENMTSSLDGLLELSNVKKQGKVPSIHLYESILLECEKEKSRIDEKKLKLTIEIPKDISISIENNHFSLLFGNLLRNAILYNKNGGDIVIKYFKNTLSIRDTGIGLDEEHQGRIFERFYRVEKNGKNPGTGIGLSIVKKIGELYGWKIAVESKKHVGTTFNLRVK